MVDRRVRPSRARDRRAGHALLAASVLAFAVGLVVFTSLVGNPVTTASDAWDDFKTQPTPTEGGSSRLGRSLGSNRYDFWRVSWDRFGERPVAGIGADNFQQVYLRAAHEPRDSALPAQPSAEGAALHGSDRRARPRRRAPGGRGRRRCSRSAAAPGWAPPPWPPRRRPCAYWLIHGAVDWFWEFPGLAAPALALLGLAAGMLPRRPELGRGRAAPARRRTRARRRGRRARARRAREPRTAVAVRAEHAGARSSAGRRARSARSSGSTRLPGSTR